jgi:hypothetical protein
MKSSQKRLLLVVLALVCLFQIADAQKVDEAFRDAIIQARTIAEQVRTAILLICGMAGCILVAQYMFGGNGDGSTGSRITNVLGKVAWGTIAIGIITYLFLDNIK